MQRFAAPKIRWNRLVAAVLLEVDLVEAVPLESVPQPPPLLKEVVSCAAALPIFASTFTTVLHPDATGR